MTSRCHMTCLLQGLAVLLWVFAPGNVSHLQAQTATKTTREKAPPVPATDARGSDRAAIRKTMQSFAEAFQKSDAVAAASFMTAEAELVPENAEPVRGRDAIQKAYTNWFAKNARPKISLAPQSLEFLSRDTAIEEGDMTLTTASGDETDETKNHYQILFAREDGKWLLASIREWVLDKPELDDLAWLIGTWSAKQPDAEVHTTYEWFGNKKFILARFSLREKETSVTGMQLIGTDPATGGLRTWTFEVDGGFGEGTCVRDGKHWIFETNTALADTSMMSATNILVPVNRNTFTWQPVNLTIDGEQVSDLPPVKVVRVMPGK